MAEEYVQLKPKSLLDKISSPVFLLILAVTGFILWTLLNAKDYTNLLLILGAIVGIIYILRFQGQREMWTEQALKDELLRLLLVKQRETAELPSGEIKMGLAGKIKLYGGIENPPPPKWAIYWTITGTCGALKYVSFMDPYTGRLMGTEPHKEGEESVNAIKDVIYLPTQQDVLARKSSDYFPRGKR